MTVVPEDRTKDNTAEEHVGDHNELARLHNLLDGGGIGQTLVIANDEDITVAASRGTTIVLFTAVTAPRVVRLPPASGPSQIVIVKDVNNQATNVNDIEFLCDGDDASFSGLPSLVHAFGDYAGSGTVATITNDGSTKWAVLSDASSALNAVIDRFGDGLIDFRVVEVTYTPEQVSTCNSNPVSFVASPGPGKIIQPVSISVQAFGGSTGFAESCTLALIFDRGFAFSSQDVFASLIGQPLPTGANDTRFAHMLGLSDVPLDVANHRGLALSCQGDHDIAYDGRIRVKMVYTLVDVLTGPL